MKRKFNSLERQAKKADKYNKISTVLREIEIDLAEREFARFNLLKEEHKNKKELNFKHKILIESELAKIEDEVKSVKVKLDETESELKSKRSEITAQTEKIYNSQKYISVSEEREKSLDRNIIRYNRNLKNLNFSLRKQRN